MTEIGVHLLGRVAPEPDDRDFDLALFFDPFPIHAALAKMMTVHKNSATLKMWATLMTNAVEPQAPPAPTPAPPSGPVEWHDPEQLDQQDTGHCVGFGWAQWGNTDPINDHYINEDGHAIYYECKVIDREPKGENGSSVHSGAKAMKARGRIGAYAWTSDLKVIQNWLLQKGPVVLGTDWTDSMFSPDSKGFVKPSGSVAGGHCYLAVGYDPDADTIKFQNSWGAGWAQNGYFYMRSTDFKDLITDGFEAATGVEL